MNEDVCAPASFRKSLERWLKHYEGNLAEPSRSDRHEMEQPFARWLPGSRAGDAPVEGPLYDFEDAVRFASAWSGIEEGMTWRILASLERFLELAGIAQAEEDEDLKRERVEAAVWLPEQPDLVDERAEGYVGWATGIGPSAISAVRRGEMAYLDQLGLVTWDSEGEREAQLGAPAWRMAGALAPPRAG
jgi:hypothetical protein